MKKIGLAALLVAVAAGPAPAAPATVAARPATVKVVAGEPTEYAYTVSEKTVKRGSVTFVVTNRGAKTHDFKIAGKRTPNLAPGASAKLTVTFAKPGNYLYFCTVPGHAVAGMKGALRVT